MSITLRVLGPVYDLDDGLRLQDVDAGCGFCGKRLALVIHDPSGSWRQMALVCIDCGRESHTEQGPMAIQSSYRAPGKRIACCRLCKWTSMPTSLQGAAGAAQQHLETQHAA